MNRRTTVIAMLLALSFLSLHSATATGKSSIIIKKAGRATSVTPNTILSGSGLPTRNLGIDGDFYIDTKNANLYGPKTKGTWKIATSLRMPTSQDLVMATNGADGVRGATGSTGSTGAKGDTGATGAKGEMGAAGLFGATGAAGLNGVNGTAGLKGENGIQGLIGASGLTGAQGLKGDAGLAGANGMNGAQGLKGDVGVAGTSGTAGTSGATGLTGLTGSTGAAGAAGTAGAAGISNTYFVDIQSWTLSTSISAGTSDSAAFGTLSSGGSYSFQIMLDGTFSPVTASAVNIGMQLKATVTPVSIQYRVFSSDSNGLINGIGGRHYQFMIMGTIVCSGATTSLTISAVDQYGATSGNALSFTGKAQINKVGSIG